ncbi:MAG: hypothetical protein ABIJ08_03625 [Nanoarchaeota archaeon]
MRTIIILALLLTALIAGCAEAPSEPTTDVTTDDVTVADTIEEVDNSLIDDSEEVEIGEMI